jgi:very-short-patch-repair endonuclease
LVTRRDLLGLGYSGRSIEHRLARGRLHQVARGVYAVGWPEMSYERRWMAAVLVCGEEAMLSHGSAAALWGVLPAGDGAVHVTVPSRVRWPEVRVHLRAARSGDSTTHRGIPVTRPIATLVDLATELGGPALERAVNEADKLDLVDPESLRSALDRAYAGRRGVRPLRALLDRHTFRLSDSDLERHFRSIALAAGLPLPLTKQRVNGFEVDFYWPRLGLVVETDGLRYHRTPAAQARDRRRDQAHTAAGLRHLRFTHWQVTREPRHVEAVLRRTSGRC